MTHKIFLFFERILRYLLSIPYSLFKIHKMIKVYQFKIPNPTSVLKGNSLGEIFVSNDAKNEYVNSNFLSTCTMSSNFKSLYFCIQIQSLKYTKIVSHELEQLPTTYNK